MAQSVEELQALVNAWQKKEDEGGTPTSKSKLAAAKAALEEAQAAAKPKKKAKKAKKAKVEKVVEEVAADEEE
tara:strand:+ start:269 stop:487 length:219 start_codon:yes stop_codon:yes gene_type:complete